MDRTCCRRRVATKRGGTGGAAGSNRSKNCNGESAGSAVDLVPGASAAKRPRGTRRTRASSAADIAPGFERCPSSSSSSSSCGACEANAATSVAEGASAALASEIETPTAGDVPPATSAEPLLFHGLRRRELLRLMLQTLNDLGLPATSAALEQESGIRLEPLEVVAFRTVVLAGNWVEAAATFSRIERVPMKSRQAIGFLISQQRFLEYLVPTQRSLKLARDCLDDLSAASFDDDSRGWLRKAQEYLDADFPQDLETALGWKPEGSREMLWNSIFERLPTDLVVPPRRLPVLLRQASKYQEQQCPHHGMAVGLGEKEPQSLLEDHVCEPPPLPAHCIGRLQGHVDEVWAVSISNSGKYLASSSKDKAVFVWECSSVGKYKVIHTLCGHTEPSTHLAWSLDDRYLLTASSDSTVRLWEPPSPDLVRKFSKHASQVTGVEWIADGYRFVTAGLDRRVRVFDIDGTELHIWEIPSHIQDLAVLKNGTHVLVVNSDRNLKILDAVTKRELPALPEGDAVTSVCASRLRDEVLVNIAHRVASSQQAPVIRLWDVVARKVAQQYHGHSQGRFVVRSCFGGQNEEFVISGSEDAHVYIWHRHFGSLMQVLSGHSATVNAVCWTFAHCTGVADGEAFEDNPGARALLFSASDDHTIRVWSPVALCPPDDEVDQPHAERASNPSPRDGCGSSNSAAAEMEPDDQDPTPLPSTNASGAVDSEGLEGSDGTDAAAPASASSVAAERDDDAVSESVAGDDDSVDMEDLIATR